MPSMPSSAEVVRFLPRFCRWFLMAKRCDKNPLPDVVFIDGGLGQLNQAIMVMDSIGVESIQLVGVAKGEGRKAGLETLTWLN
jgi:excinuclease UvrABC nuclease subunit